MILLLGFPRISIQHLCLPHIYSIHEGLLLARWLVCQLRSAEESFLALDPSQIWWVILGYPWFKSAHPHVAICCFPNPKRSTKYYVSFIMMGSLRCSNLSLMLQITRLRNRNLTNMAVPELLGVKPLTCFFLLAKSNSSNVVNAMNLLMFCEMPG